ncbi:MAG: hypothetical protein RMZ43_009515 [Nostoc sp. CmiVER01]|uniref:hypothetical protein n=1 Tax=Nostoc sp. CmiVER01 TaxID=3075384 RepID=UPI002AD49C07|nr:hypothetical protein [Nostoc sp. CmiVER01]MDZ8123533.1 hypothetical protein [Nostoc sp. CmiVER01]
MVNSSLNLSDLNGANGFAINGINEGDRSGVSVSSAGDVNSDGIADLIIGAFGADPNGDDSGQSYVVFGKKTGWSATLNLSDLNGANGFAINGINEDDTSGSSVSSAGDVNSDGIDDLIIGAFFADPNGIKSGQGYVVFGKRTGWSATLNLSDLNGANGFAINGIAADDILGRSVSSAGDVNSDGIADLIIGAYRADSNGDDSGQSYVVFGKKTGWSATLNLSDLNGANGFAINGIAAEDSSGFSVSSAGDVNSDGIADLIIGAQKADPNGYNSGQSYVVFGKKTGWSATLNLSDLNGANGFAINGINEGDESGVSVSSAGDVNSDGIDDLIIGADGADPNGYLSGQSYVVFGKRTGWSATFNLSDLNGANGFAINAINESDFLGFSVSSAGDVNSDGIDDLIIAADSASPNGYLSGQSYVLFGKRTGWSATFNLSDLNGANGFIINGISLLDRSGYSVSSAGDVNSDGIADLIIGAFRASPNDNSSAGQSYVIFGGKNIGKTSTINLTGTAGKDTLVGTDSNNIIDGNAGNDIINGFGGNDLLRGGSGNDTLTGGFGNDTLVGGAGNDVLTGGTGADKFIYNTDAAFALSGVGVDAIADFKSSQGDQIILDKTTFSAIASTAGASFSNNSDFEITSSAGTSRATIVYDPVSGQLFYNPNGSAAGFGSGGLFATLTGAPTLTALNFVVQA